MDLRVQCLYPPIHHLWKACDVFDEDDRNALAPQRFGRPAGRDDLPPEARERAGELDQAAFIGNREERSAHQSSATARTMSVKLNRSFRSTTSAGECE